MGSIWDRAVKMKNPSTFVNYVTQAQGESWLTSVLAKAKLFFSVQADGSSDGGNVEDKLFVFC